MDEDRGDEAGQDEAALDEAGLDRLRAGDPARDVDVPEERLRAELTRRTGVPLGDEGSSGTTDGGGQVVPLTPRRRRRAAWTAAAAVAGALVVGAGGYGIGVAAGGGGGGTSTVTALPALSLAGGGTSSAAGDTSALGASGAAPETSRAAGDSAYSSSLVWGGGRTVFEGSGLGDERSTARAWALDASAVVDEATARRVAAALGVAGEPVAQYGSWTVGSTDGSGPSLYLGNGGQVSYYAPTTTVCQPVGDVVAPQPAPLEGATTEEGPSAGSGTAVDPGTGVGAPGACTIPPTDEAVARLTSTAEALGTDLAGWAVGTTSDGVGVNATATRVVDGRAAGEAWSAYVTSDGLVSFTANLSSLVDLGTYDVISAQEAVDRLNDPRFGAGGGMIAYDARAAGTADVGDASADAVAPAPEESTPPTAVPVPAPGAALPWPVQTVTLVSAELTVASTWTPDGASLLVPTWALTAADGTVWTVVAVTEEGLDLTGR